VVARRRPGQRAIARKARCHSGYDLAADKLVRAKARFEGLSLGEAACKYIDKPYLTVGKCESYIAKDKIDLTDNVKPSYLECELDLKISSYDENQSSLRDLNVALYDIIKSHVIRGIVRELAKAKRARHTGNVINYAEELARSPRYLLLILDHEMESTIPY
jgi:hypothetical protein